jgi:uncharacterized membrane protein
MKKLIATTAIAIVLGCFSANANDADNGADGPHRHYMQDVIAKLPQDKADLFKDSMAKVHEQNKEQMGKIKTLYGDLRTILTAPKFDKSAYLKKAGEIAKLQEKMHKNRTEAFADVATKLNQDDRQTLAEGLEHHGHHDHKSGGVAGGQPGQ